jgi:hypothetical protein
MVKQETQNPSYFVIRHKVSPLSKESFDTKEQKTLPLITLPTLFDKILMVKKLGGVVW